MASVCLFRNILESTTRLHCTCMVPSEWILRASQAPGALPNAVVSAPGHILWPRDLHAIPATCEWGYAMEQHCGIWACHHPLHVLDIRFDCAGERHHFGITLPTWGILPVCQPRLQLAMDVDSTWCRPELGFRKAMLHLACLHCGCVCRFFRYVGFLPTLSNSHFSLGFLFLVVIHFRSLRVKWVKRESEHWIGRWVYRMGACCVGLTLCGLLHARILEICLISSQLVLLNASPGFGFWLPSTSGFLGWRGFIKNQKPELAAGLKECGFIVWVELVCFVSSSVSGLHRTCPF